MSGAFNPNDHLIKISKKDYLPVAWRMVWLRSVHPDASIETELVRADERGATIRADVSWPIMTPAGDNYHVHVVHNTGYAMEPWEKPGRMGPALENAETSAVGRALAAAGFGTQFAPELDFDSGGDRVTDTPVQSETAGHPRNRIDRQSIERTEIMQELPRLTDRRDLAAYKQRIRDAGLSDDVDVTAFYAAAYSRLHGKPSPSAQDQPTLT